MTALSEIEADGPDSIRIHAILSNTELEQGYYLRTVGLYALDPDEGEILYGVSAETSEDGCYVPPFRGRTASNLYFNLSVAVGNSENVVLEVNQGAVATVKQLDKVRYPAFETADERVNLVSGERQETMFGKIARWFADLKAVAFSGSYRDLSDRPALGSAAAQDVANDDATTAEGYVLDARVAKVHGDEIDSLQAAFAGHKTSGDHDGRYYTEAEVNDLLAGKSGTTHTHDERYYTEGEVNNLLAGKSGTTHTHDERYYTEGEVNNLLAGKIATTASCNKNWNWSGQGGQPSWLWGGNDGNNMYVYNPSNFSVAYAETAHGLRTYSASGSSHGGSFIMKVRHNLFGNDNCFGLFIENGGALSHAVKVHYAAHADDAIRLGVNGGLASTMTFNWSGQSGQPTWLWGGNDVSNMYVWNPSNFRVSYADNAGMASKCTEGIASPLANRAVDLNADGTIFRSYDNNIQVVDNAIYLGNSSSRWKQVFAATSAISTSDRNYKKEIKPLSEQHLRFFMLLQPVSFLFKDGDSNRTHIGFISQDVESAMKECGLTDLDFAGFCKDIRTVCHVEKDKDGNRREIEEPVLDENGSPEYIYSLRYEEFIALNTHMIQTVVNRMEEMDRRITDLEKQIAGAGKPEQ